MAEDTWTISIIMSITHRARAKTQERTTHLRRLQTSEFCTKRARESHAHCFHPRFPLRTVHVFFFGGFGRRILSDIVCWENPERNAVLSFRQKLSGLLYSLLVRIMRELFFNQQCITSFWTSVPKGSCTCVLTISSGATSIQLSIWLPWGRFFANWGSQFHCGHQEQGKICTAVCQCTG